MGVELPRPSQKRARTGHPVKGSRLEVVGWATRHGP